MPQAAWAPTGAAERPRRARDRRRWLTPFDPRRDTMTATHGWPPGMAEGFDPAIVEIGGTREGFVLSYTKDR